MFGNGNTFGVVISLIGALAIAGCTGPGEVPERYRAHDAAVEPATKAPSESASGASASSGSGDASASEGDGSATPAKAGFRTERSLPLEGNVRFSLIGGCRGCSGGSLDAEASVEGDVITIEGEVSGCEGSCTAHRPATGSVLVRRLRPRTYDVRSKLRVTKVSPLSLGAAKRTEWALFLLGESCEEGLGGLTGNERATKALLSKVGDCLSKARPEIRRATYSSMLGWKNNGAYVPELIKALDDDNVGYLAARVLGRIEDERAIAPLIEALGSRDESLRWDAARSLEMITERDYGEDQARWKAWHAERGAR